jgi:hypothetical protein
MDACNPFSFYRLGTLSIAMGVYTPYFDPPLSPVAHTRTNRTLLPLVPVGSILKVIQP